MPQVAIIEVRQELIEHTEDLVIRVGRGSEICKAGMQFGSLYPGSPAETVVYDFLPDDQLREAANLGDFCGIFVFDKWTCNTNGRQAIFFRADGEARYRAQMIDQGFCFNAAEWNFPDAPLRGLYTRHRVYESVRGMGAFDPWIARIQTNVTPGLLDEISREIPPEWYNDEQDLLWRLMEQLLRRKKLVPELILSAWKSSAQPFPNWK